MKRLVALFAICCSCIGTTGSELVTFEAYAASVIGENPAFVNGKGWTVHLTNAKMHIGGIYLNRAVPVSGGQERECFLPGVYVAQVPAGVDLLLLNPHHEPFPVLATGTEDFAATGEVWLTGGRIDALDDRTVIAEAAGTAMRGAESMRWEATVTIGRNRAAAATDPARPGANPLCAERIVTPIPVAITPQNGGRLLLRIDPRAWFANVEFGELEPVSPGSDLRRFPDDNSSQPAINLYRGIRSATGVYSFEFTSRVR